MWGSLPAHAVVQSLILYQIRPLQCVEKQQNTLGEILKRDKNLFMNDHLNLNSTRKD